MKLPFTTLLQKITVLILFTFTLPTIADVDIDALRNRTPDDLKAQSDKAWDEHLRPGAFQKREINENQADAVIEIKAPFRSNILQS